MKKCTPTKSERGIAMILTLAILVVVTLLVVAFAVSMRVENTASKNFNDLIKARQMAQAGVDHAIATIRSATQPISPNYNYVTAPGAIYTWTGGAWTSNALFTTGIFKTDVDLNTNNLITGTGPEYTNGSPLLIGWTNITVIGSTEMIGRFAYWVDDESAKVNLNVAGLRANDPEGHTPAAIDLAQLFTAGGDLTPLLDAQDIINYTTGVRALDTTESLKMTAPPLAPPAPGITTATYGSNQFYMTVNSTSPDITPWGTKRVNLADIATNTVLTADQKVVAITNALNEGNLTNLFGLGQTFFTKYTNLAQVAANIIDYIDIDNIPTDSTPLGPVLGPLDTAQPTYLGLEQTPYLNEIAITNTLQATGTGESGPYTLQFTTSSNAELWYMYTNADWTTPAGPPGSTQILLLNRPTVTIIPAPPETINGEASLTLGLPAAGTITVFGVIPRASPYRTFSLITEVLTPTNPAVVPPFIMTTNIATMVLNSGIVTAIFRNKLSGRFDYAVIPLASYTNTFNANVVPTPFITNLTWASACNDPRVKPVSNNWVPLSLLPPFTNTLGGINTGVLDPTVGTAVIPITVPPITVPADGDTSCHIVSGSRDRGTMTPAELSFIHTGYPWRTFWLQPQPALEGNSVPDWAALDLFSGTDALNVVGRININSFITNSDVTTTFLPWRTAPLSALLPSSVAGITYDQGIASTNIYDYAYLPASHVAQLPLTHPSFSPYAYTMVGEIANTRGLSDSLPADATHTKSTRETPVRGIANLITTRSDTFTIWCVAQTIKDVDKNGQYDPPPAGNDSITGEAKVQAIVQRYEEPPGTVKFRTLYYRYIYN